MVPRDGNGAQANAPFKGNLGMDGINIAKVNKRCLVAGGAGFIGNNLCRYFINRGWQVDCIDNLSTGRLESISDLIGKPGFQFLKMDVADAKACRRLLRRQYAEVYHLACPTGVPNISRMGDVMLLASSLGTIHLLKIARRSKAKFLFASTAEIYGDPEIFPQTESYNGNVDPVGPRSAYEEGKRFGEAMTRHFGKQYGIDAFIVRIFNTYGPGMSPKDERVIPQMLRSLVEGRPVRIYGDGSQNRTFLHIEDLIEGFRRLMSAGTPGEVYNIGSRRQLTIRELYTMAVNATGRRQPAAFTEHFIEDHRGRLPDTSKLEALGWRQQISLEDGLRESFAKFVHEIESRDSSVRSKRARARVIERQDRELRLAQING